MAKITIDCADPNDFTAVTEAAERAAGRCNITYAKQAAAMVDAGTVRSERKAAKQIAEETGEPLETVRTMVKRGKKEMGSGEPKKKPAPSDQPRPHRTYAEVYQATERRMAAAAKYLWDEHPGSEAEKAEALRLILQSIESRISKVEEPADLTPAKAARHEIARNVLKPCAEKAITAAIRVGLDKALHLGDEFSVALSTSAGSGKLLVAEVTFKKIGGT